VKNCCALLFAVEPAMNAALCCLATLLSLIVVMMVPSSSDAAPPAGQQEAAESTVKLDDREVTLRYLLFVPKGAAQEGKWPLLLFLHGAGERGDDLNLVKKWGPPGFVEQRTDFPFIVVSPQCPTNERWDEAALARLVDQLSSELPIDKQRMYITGLSMGGYGTWNILAQHPRLFAAAVPICGGGEPQTAAALTDIPIWAFHGDEDRAVPLERSQEMVDAIHKAGGTKVKLTIYPGVGHNSWSQTYDNEEVFKWLLSHKRAD
jgi:predicted peptidase